MLLWHYAQRQSKKINKFAYLVVHATVKMCSYKGKKANRIKIELNIESWGKYVINATGTTLLNRKDVLYNGMKVNTHTVMAKSVVEKFSEN